MKNLKKLLASALLVCMLVSMLPVSALAEGCAHNYVMTVTANPGCTSVGSASYTCSACENTYNAEIPATGHSYQVTATTAPTCAAAGSTTHTCSHCGDSYTETISATGVHNFGAATCTAPKTCKVCTATEGEPLGHDYAPATCTTAKTCKVCTATEGEPLGHTAGETVTESATCTVDGSITVKCSVCGEDASTEIISAPGHTAGESEVTTAPNCTEDGVKSVKCTVCGDSYNEAIPALGHSYEEAVTTEATCTEKGVKTFSCTVDDCEDSYTEDIEALGHEYLNATCTAPKTCGRCEATEGEALGHKYENGMCSVCYALCAHSGGEASCTELAVCEICGLSYGELGHVGGVASCVALAVCEKCSQPYGDYGHKGGSADCEEKAVCELCGQPYGEPLGHKYNEQHECSVCGKKEPPLKNVLKGNSLSISGNTVVHVGKTITLSASESSVTWGSSNPAVATVTDGLVTGESAGAATITASSDGKTATIDITVSDHDYTGAWKNDNLSHWKECSCGEQKENGVHTTKFDSANNIFVCKICGYEVDNKGAPAISSEVADGQPIPVGKEFTMYLSRNIIGLSVTWQSGDESVVKHEGEAGFGMHKFKALAAGTATITASYEGGSVSRTVTVVEATTPATKITLTAPETVYVGDSFDVTYALDPTDSTDTVTWEISDTTKVVPGLPIDGGMPFYASAAGTVTITAKANDNATASATVTVVEKTIQITGGNTKLAKDATLTLTATVTPDTNESTPIEWTSSDPDIATVGKDTGVVTGKAKGTATITATANDNSGASASVKVYVYEDNTGYIAVEKDLIEVGESIEVRLVHPAVGDMDPVTWSVNDENVAAINGEGCVATVTGKLSGIGEQFTISAEANNKTITVTRANMAVNTPNLTVTGADSVLVGKTAQFAATVSPKYKDGITINWTSSETKIATVDKNGVVTGVANGTVMITATASDDDRITASKEITVKAPDLTVSGPGTVAVGKTITLTAKVGPDEVTDKTVTWKSSDETIATVDKDGKVTGKKVGDVKITATSNAYKNLAVEFPVKVTAAVYLYYGNGSHFNGIHPMPFVSSDLWAGGAGVNVIINGVPLVPGRDFSCYSSPHGMIGVTVNPGLLRLLPQNAWHSIEIVSANGVAAGSFSTGYFGYYNIYGVKTGDDSTPLLWAALCLLGISGAGIILAKSRKRKA